MPELVRAALGEAAPRLRTVHRLDRVVGGVLLLACTARSAADLSAQIRAGSFQKEYLALCCGAPPDRGEMTDELCRDRALHKTLVCAEAAPDTRPARLEYETLARLGEQSLVRIRLITGRPHQIRAQFSARGFPLAGDGKYGAPSRSGEIGLWSWRIRFRHPRTDAAMTVSAPPPPAGVWAAAAALLEALPRELPDTALGRFS